MTMTTPPPLAVARLGAVIFSRGFRLNPTPQEAVSYYLPRLIAGAPLHAAVRAFIHRADVHACSPAELARRFRPMPRTGDRFFFAPCKKAARAGAAATAGGSWAAQTTVEIMRGEVQIGELRKLRFKKGGVLTDWLMDEYSSCAAAGDKQQQPPFVFCKVYVSPRADPTSAAHRESAAFFAPPPMPMPPPAIPAAAVIAQPAAKSTAPPLLRAAMPLCAKRIAPPPRQVAMPPPPLPQVAMPPCAKRAAPPPQAAMAPCAKRMRVPVVQTAPQHPPSAAPIRSMLTAAQKFYFAPPQPCAPPPFRGSPAPSVTRTQPSPAPIQHPAPPVPTRSVVELRRSPMPAPPPVLARPVVELRRLPMPAPPPVLARSVVKPHRSLMAAPPRPPLARPMQQVPLAIPPVVSASCHMSRQAPAPPPCPPQVSVQPKEKRILDPFQAAILREEPEKQQTVAAAPDPPPPSKQFPAAALVLQDEYEEDEDEYEDWSDLDKELGIQE